MVEGRCHYCGRRGKLLEKLIGNVVRQYCSACKSRARQEKARA